MQVTKKRAISRVYEQKSKLKYFSRKPVKKQAIFHAYQQKKRTISRTCEQKSGNISVLVWSMHGFLFDTVNISSYFEY
jgi:hypothetical protein